MLALILTLLLAGANDQKMEPANTFVPNVPAGETITAEHESFANECLEAAKAHALRNGWTLGAALVTISPTWGVVWRADFTTSDEKTSPYVNRITCWQDKNKKLSVSIAVGQDEEPLFVKK